MRSRHLRRNGWGVVCLRGYGERRVGNGNDFLGVCGRLRSGGVRSSC